MALAEPAAAPPFERLVLFDGVCAFCDAAVRWLMDRDPDARLRFAPLQGTTAEALRARHPEISRDIDTLVFVEAGDGSERVYLRSEAILRAWGEVEPDRWMLRLLRRVPRPLAELGYAVFVRFRYRVFGRFEACRVPTAEERDRFLD